MVYEDIGIKMVDEDIFERILKRKLIKKHQISSALQIFEYYNNDELLIDHLNHKNS